MILKKLVSSQSKNIIKRAFTTRFVSTSSNPKWNVDKGQTSSESNANCDIHNSLIFRQLFHADTFTYTYLLGCTETKHAVIIDPVMEMVERDAQYIKELDLKLLFGINTHVHADHITGTRKLKEYFSTCQSVISKNSKAEADVHFDHEASIYFGKQELRCLETPGHTAGCSTFVLDDHRIAFTGDALLIRGCGRTDFQQGDPSLLYKSVHGRILSLPGDYSLYPGHDYKGFTKTTVAEEKEHNPRLTLTHDNFVTFMRDLNLAYPKLIDLSVPANLKCGQYSKEAYEGTMDIINKTKIV